MKNCFFQLNEDIIIKVIDGEAVIVFVENAIIMSMNGSGTFILEQLRKSAVPLSFENLLYGIIERYAIEEETAAVDLNAFLVKLNGNNLIDIN